MVKRMPNLVIIAPCIHSDHSSPTVRQLCVNCQLSVQVNWVCVCSTSYKVFVSVTMWDSVCLCTVVRGNNLSTHTVLRPHTLFLPPVSLHLCSCVLDMTVRIAPLLLDP